MVFGLWAATLFLGMAALKGSFHDAVAYIESLNFTEPRLSLSCLGWREGQRRVLA